MRYIGHILTSGSVNANPSKLDTIIHMPKPNDINGVQRLLGVVNYLTKFMSNLSDLWERIRRLTHKDAVWVWTFEQESALDKINDAVCNTPVLRFFYSKEKTPLQCDSSKSGLGDVWFQKRPVDYSSLALTDTEKSYAKIEKELLAVVFVVKHFYQLTYRLTVYIESDYKPSKHVTQT